MPNRSLVRIQYPLPGRPLVSRLANFSDKFERRAEVVAAIYFLLCSAAIASRSCGLGLSQVAPLK